MSCLARRSAPSGIGSRSTSSTSSGVLVAGRSVTVRRRSGFQPPTSPAAVHVCVSTGASSWLGESRPMAARSTRCRRRKAATAADGPPAVTAAATRVCCSTGEASPRCGRTGGRRRSSDSRGHDDVRRDSVADTAAKRDAMFCAVT